MPGRLPRPSDFPPSLKIVITPPPAFASRHTNVLILLHGLGDTLDSFSQLGKRLNLPETTCIALQGSAPTPFDLGGFSWGDDVTFTQSSDDLKLDIDHGFSKSTAIIEGNLINEGLIKQCGYDPKEIMLLGFGQGGVAALAAAASIKEELAGVITIGGPFPLSARATAISTSTPVILLGGSSTTSLTPQRIDDTKAIFKNVEYHQFERPGDGMPTNRDETFPIMRFLARRLRSQIGVPKGSFAVT